MQRMTLAATVPAPTTLRVGRCEHLRKRSHKFVDNVIIEYCPDCSRFDNSRRHVLNPAGIPGSVKKAFERLRESGYDIRYVRIGKDCNKKPIYGLRIRKD